MTTVYKTFLTRAFFNNLTKKEMYKKIDSAVNYYSKFSNLKLSKKYIKRQKDLSKKLIMSEVESIAELLESKIKHSFTKKDIVELEKILSNPLYLKWKKFTSSNEVVNRLIKCQIETLRPEIDKIML